MNHRRNAGRQCMALGGPLAPVLGAAVLLVLALPVLAQPAAKGAGRAASDAASLVDSRGEVVRNASYLCWHTGFWTPAAAIAECDPDLVPKAAPPVANAKPAAKPPAKGATARP